MSALMDETRPSSRVRTPRTEAETDAPALTALARRRPTISGLPYVLVLLALLGAGMAFVLLLNTRIQQQQMQVDALQQQAAQLGYQEAALQAQVNQLRSATNLAQAASQLGMRPNPHPAVIEMPQGTIVGDPEPVDGMELPALIWTPPATPAPSPSPAAASPGTPAPSPSPASASSGPPIDVQATH